MPVYSSHLLSYQDLGLGRKVREGRLQRNLTLRDLAAKVSISSAQLSEIENEHHRLDLRQAADIAAALELPLDSFLPRDVAVPYQICRATDVRSKPGREIELRGGAEETLHYHNRVWPLADLFVGRHLEPVLVQVMPVEDRDLRLCYHHEQEFVFIVKGSVEFIVATPEGRASELLQRGDCIYFRSDLPHALRSCGTDVAESLHVFSSPSAPADPGLKWAAHAAATTHREDLLRQTGQRVRLLRETRGWTTTQLAAACAVGERQLRQIEEGARSVHIETLLTLARVFGKPLAELVGKSGGEGPYYYVQRADAMAAVASRQRRTPVERQHAPKSKTCQPMSGSFPARAMYPCLLRLLNVELETLTLHEHHGQEFMYVLEGELELITYAGSQRVTETLRAGDSCYLDSSVPHLLHSSTRNPYSETSATVIDVFWCPLGESYLLGPP